MTRHLTIALSLAVLAGAGLASCDTQDPPLSRDALATPDALGDAAADGTPGGDAIDAGGSPGDDDAALAGSDAAIQIGASTGAFTIYPQAGGAPNPATNIAGSATAWDVGGGMMRLELNVTGLLPHHNFGAHLHKLACDVAMADGHYQNMPAPDADAGAGPGGPNDPAYGNPSNEAWLDFTTDDNGAAMSWTMVPWLPQGDKAKGIVVHAMGTAEGGVAGAKLACLGIVFR